MNIIFKNKKYDPNRLERLLNEYHINFSEVKSIAVIMKRSPQMLWLFYKAFSLGITYIPIDPEEPIDRIDYILNQTQPDIILCDNYKYHYSKTHSNNYNNIGYILYTSGTTGLPKGVLVQKESLENFIEGFSEKIDFSSKRKIASFTSISFDIFFLESVLALSKKMTIVLADEEEQVNPRAMAKLIFDNDIDMLQLTPSRLQLLLNYDKNLHCLQKVQDILIGGETLPIKLLEELQKKTKAKIYNLYGPTETTIWSTIGELTNSSSVNIGCPIKNTNIYILDEKMNVLPAGKKGEICISGKGLAKGYLQNDLLTAEKFVTLQNDDRTIVYKTGDIGIQNADGTFDYLGRMDNQIKLRGHRVELEEIEANINKYGGISRSLVCVHTISEMEKVLHVFYEGDNEIVVDDIKNFLKNKVPSYMIPDVYEKVDNFVQTINGKINRRYYNDRLNAKDVHLVEEMSKETLNIGKAILQIIKDGSKSDVCEVSERQNFKEIGYDSISFIKIILEIEERFGFEFDDEYLIISKYQCVGDMIDYVANKVASNICDTPI